MLNETPNNKDIMCIENIMMNEASNSNDATRVANNVHLTTVDAHPWLYSHHAEKSTYQR